jgi:glycogen operon protein
MSPEDWEEEDRRCLGMWLHGDAIPETDERGQPLRDASFLALFNAGHEPVTFALPDPGAGWSWAIELDTRHEDGDPPHDAPAPGSAYELQGRSTVLLRQVEGPR